MDWHTSDHHFFHDNIIVHSGRPFADVQEMNEALIDNHNAVVKPTDRCYFHGDVAMHPKNIHPVSRMNGRKILIAGNHDTCWCGHKRAEKAKKAVQLYLDAGFDEVIPSGVLRNHVLGTIPVTLSHLPYQGDHTETDRYADRRPEDLGQPLLCGHVHEAWKISGRQINVGVDVWDYRPVSADELISVVATLPKR